MEMTPPLFYKTTLNDLELTLTARQFAMVIIKWEREHDNTPNSELRFANTEHLKARLKEWGVKTIPLPFSHDLLVAYMNIIVAELLFEEEQNKYSTIVEKVNHGDCDCCGMPALQQKSKQMQNTTIKEQL